MKKHPFSLLFCALLTTAGVLAKEEAKSLPTAGLLTKRARDELSINFGETDVCYFQVLKVETRIRPENLDSDINRADLFILPVLREEAQGGVLLFPVLKPTITVSSGRVDDLRFTRGDAVRIEEPQLMTSEGLYSFSVLFGKEIPREFTVTISMTAPRNSKDHGSTLLCRMSDDGVGHIYGKPASFLRVLDAYGTRYVVKNGEAEMHRGEDAWVQVEAEKHYIVRPSSYGHH